MTGKVKWNWGWDAMGRCCLWYAEKKIPKNSVIRLCDNFCCKIATESTILVLLVTHGLERHNK